MWVRVLIMNEKLKLVENVKTTDNLKKLFKNQSNPIQRNLISFVNAKIGEKFSIKDLLR